MDKYTGIYYIQNGQTVDPNGNPVEVAREVAKGKGKDPEPSNSSSQGSNDGNKGDSKSPENPETPREGTKDWYAAELTRLGIAFDPQAKKEDLEALYEASKPKA